MRDYLGPILAASLGLTLLGMVMMRNYEEAVLAPEPVVVSIELPPLVISVPLTCSQTLIEGRAHEACDYSNSCYLEKEDYVEYNTGLTWYVENCNERKASEKPKESLSTQEFHRCYPVGVGDCGAGWGEAPDVQAQN